MGKILPWKCHICSVEFYGAGGGVCDRCKQPTCMTHLQTLGRERKPKKQEMDQPVPVCAECILPEELSDDHSTKKSKKLRDHSSITLKK